MSDGAPPIFGSWKRLYLALLVELALLILGFRLFTWMFS